VSDIGQNSVTLSWQPGESQVINRTIVEYRQSSAPADQWQRRVLNTSSDEDGDGRSRRSAAAETDFYVLDALEAETEYVVRIIVHSFNKASHSLAASFTTRESATVFANVKDYLSCYTSARLYTK